MKSDERRLTILAIDDFSIESINAPLSRLGIVQAGLCDLRYETTLVDGKRLIDKLSDRSEGPSAGLALFDMSFDSDSITPKGEKCIAASELAELQEVFLGYTEGMPLSNGGLWLAKLLLQSQLSKSFIPVVYTARTEIIDTLMPISEMASFKVLDQIPAERQVSILLDSLVNVLQADGVCPPYDYILSAFRDYINTPCRGREIYEDIRVMKCAPNSNWKLQYVFPHVFGRLRMKLSSRLSQNDVSPVVVSEFGHLLRLCSMGHQGRLLNQLLSPGDNGYPPELKLQAREDYEGSMTSQHKLQSPKDILDSFESLLNRDTFTHIQDIISPKEDALHSDTNAEVFDQPALSRLRERCNVMTIVTHLPTLLNSLSHASIRYCQFGETMEIHEWQSEIRRTIGDTILDSAVLLRICSDILSIVMPVTAPSKATVDLSKRGAYVLLTIRITPTLMPDLFAAGLASVTSSCGRNRGFSVLCRLFSSDNHEIMNFDPSLRYNLPHHGLVYGESQVAEIAIEISADAW